VGFDLRHPEGGAIPAATLRLFSRIALRTSRAAASRVRRILKTDLREGIKLLDIGTGPGLIPIHLRRSLGEARFIGLDVSPEMLRIASSHMARISVDVAFVAGDAEKLPFEAGSLDLITCLFTLHHLDHPEGFLRELDRVLVPGGRLLLIDFRRDMAGWLFGVLNTLWRGLFWFSRGREGFRDSVRSAYRPREMEEMIRANGIHRFQVRWNPVELWILTR